MAKLSRFFASRWGIITAGAAVGILAPILQKLGNPGNMGICVACFERDIAGALGLHRAAVVQYLRPEIPGFILGSLIAALIFGEFRPRSGSAPIVRFFLGVLAMIGALVFLGCPWRALLRLAGGDGNAILALLGLAVGIAIGVWFLKQGYSLGRSHQGPSARRRSSWDWPCASPSASPLERRLERKQGKTGAHIRGRDVMALVADGHTHHLAAGRGRPAGAHIIRGV